MQDAINTSFSEIFLASEFVWAEIEVGDLIMLEADFYDTAGLKLHKQHAYQVLSKLNNAGNISFVVESDIEPCLVAVHPALICSYKNSSQPVARA